MSKLVARLASSLNNVVVPILVFATMLLLGLAARADSPAPAATPSQAALLDVLKSNASLEQKSIACHQLAWIGNRDAVPVLAGLLADEKLSHMARYALEQIPDPSVNEALRAAVPKLKGKLLAGVLSSLGARRDEKSIGMLSEKVLDPDTDVACAAAFALGKISTPAAGTAIEEEIFGVPTTGKPKLWDGKTPFFVQPPVVESALCDAALRCAAKLLKEGHRDQAVRLYDRLAGADEPIQFRVAATRGAILNGPHAQALLANLLESDDSAMFKLGLQLAQEFPPPETTNTCVAHLAKLSPAKLALLIQALGKRGDKTALPAIRGVTGHSEPAVRIAMIQSLAQMSDKESLPLILAGTTSSDKSVSEAAIAVVIKMPAGDIDAALADMVASPDNNRRVVAINCLAQRRTASATQALLKIAAEGEPQIRQTAIKALSRVASEADLPQALVVLQKATSPGDESAAENAVAAICISASDKEACSEKVVAALGRSSTEQRVAMLRVLSAVGGAKGLQAVRDAMKSGPKDVRQAAIVALCVWPDQAAAPDLLVLARDPTDSANKIRAVRGYLRLALDVDLAPEKRLEMAAAAQPLIERNEERRVLLRVLSRIQSTKSLTMIEPFLDAPEVKSDAATAAIAVAGKLAQAQDAKTSAAAIIAAMDKVKQANADSALVKKASEIAERVHP